MSTVTDDLATTPSVWSDVVGQHAAVEQLRRAADEPVHAYLFVGPPGSTKDRAARAFAARILSGGDDPTHRDARLALAGEHPDVREVEREGARISAEQAREIVRVASLAPVEGPRKVLVLHEFHLLHPEGAAILLKTIEEPPPSTIFVVLADHVPSDLVTISSRCVRVGFRAIPDDVLVDRLVADGVPAERAAQLGPAALGDLDRARLLAADPESVARRRRFAEIPTRIDGTGATAFAIVDEVLAAIDEAATPLAERHAAEADELQARIQAMGERGSGKKALEARHKRELRRHRADELRAGLSALAGTYRDALVEGDPDRARFLVDAVGRIHEAMEAIDRNVNEPLLLQSLIWSLPRA